MLYFENDYCEGAHPLIMQKLSETNLENYPDMVQTNIVKPQKTKSEQPVMPGKRIFSFWQAEHRPMRL